MSTTTLLTALGLALILEGLMPFLSPRSWREALTHMLQLQDGQIRFMGLAGVLGGGVLLWLAG